MEEIWQSVPDKYWRPGEVRPMYEVSCLGHVRKIHRMADGVIKVTMLKSKLDAGKQVCVMLWEGDKGRVAVSVRNLVATAFVPNPRGVKYVRHKDGDKTNNVASNLEWCTFSEIKKGLTEVVNGVERPKRLAERPVRQYSLEGEFIAEYPSATDAAEKMTINVYSITASCQRSKKNKTCLGYLWRFVDDDEFREG